MLTLTLISYLDHTSTQVYLKKNEVRNFNIYVEVEVEVEIFVQGGVGCTGGPPISTNFNFNINFNICNGYANMSDMQP